MTCLGALARCCNVTSNGLASRLDVRVYFLAVLAAYGTGILQTSLLGYYSVVGTTVLIGETCSPVILKSLQSSFTHSGYGANQTQLAVQVQALLGASRAVAFDLTAACSGFVLALVTGAQYLRAGAAQNVLVIGADALSRYVDWRDRCAPSCAGRAVSTTLEPR